MDEVDLFRGWYTFTNRSSVSTAARLAARKEGRMRAIMFLLLDYEYRNLLA